MAPNSARNPIPHVIPSLEPSGAERRVYSRISHPPLIVSGLSAQVVDVSEGGMCLRLEEPPAVGTRFELILSDSVVNFAQEVTAEVVWARGDFVGMRWVNPEPQLVRWFQHRFGQWPGKTRLLFPRRERQAVSTRKSHHVWVTRRTPVLDRRLRQRKVDLSRW